MKVYELIRELVKYGPNDEVHVRMKDFSIKWDKIAEIKYDVCSSYWGEVFIVLDR